MWITLKNVPEYEIMLYFVFRQLDLRKHSPLTSSIRLFTKYSLKKHYPFVNILSLWIEDKISKKLLVIPAQIHILGSFFKLKFSVSIQITPMLFVITIIFQESVYTPKIWNKSFSFRGIKILLCNLHDTWYTKHHKQLLSTISFRQIKSWIRDGPKEMEMNRRNVRNFYYAVSQTRDIILQPSKHRAYYKRWLRIISKPRKSLH